MERYSAQYVTNLYPEQNSKFLWNSSAARYFTLLPLLPLIPDIKCLDTVRTYKLFNAGVPYLAEISCLTDLKGFDGACTTILGEALNPDINYDASSI